MWGRYPAPVKKSSDTKDTKDTRKIKNINLTAKTPKGIQIQWCSCERIAARKRSIRRGATDALEEPCEKSAACPINSRSSWILLKHSFLNALIHGQVDETNTGDDHVNQHFCL